MIAEARRLAFNPAMDVKDLSHVALTECQTSLNIFISLERNVGWRCCYAPLTRALRMGKSNPMRLHKCKSLNGIAWTYIWIHKFFLLPQFPSLFRCCLNSRSKLNEMKLKVRHPPVPGGFKAFKVCTVASFAAIFNPTNPQQIRKMHAVEQTMKSLEGDPRRVEINLRKLFSSPVVDPWNERGTKSSAKGFHEN